MSVCGDKQGRAGQGAQGRPSPAVFSYRQGRGRAGAARANTRPLFSVTLAFPGRYLLAALNFGAWEILGYGF
jgi:hypothetical protein